MIRNGYYKTSEIFNNDRIGKLTEHFNEYGYNLSSSRKNVVNNYDIYKKTGSCKFSKDNLKK